MPRHAALPSWSRLRGSPPKRHAAGYYPAGGAPKSNQQAQIDMIEETLSWAGVDTPPKTVGAAGEGCL
jgi:hypothetical protein